jgi:futalosine hydrolase
MKHTSNSSPVVLVTVAVPTEARAFRDHFSHSGEDDIGGRSITTTRINETTVYLMVTGPGIVNAAQAVSAAVETIQPKLIINSGCAGFFPSSGMNVGDIGIASEEILIELGLEPTNDMFPDELPFDILCLGKTSCKHRYPVDPKSVSQVYGLLKNRFNFSVSTGPFVTVSTITTTDERMMAAQKRYAPIMEAMEGAAVAQVSLHYGIAFLEIRAASNRVGTRTRSSWNIPLACRHSALAVVSYLKSTTSKT